MIAVQAVETSEQRKNFIDYPYQKYQDDPNWVPPLRLSEAERLNPKKNPFFEHARVELYLAQRHGATVGRVALIDDDLHNKTHHDNLVFFGFFEAEDEEVAAALYAQLERRARKLGRGRIRGPVNPNLNESAGFQLNAFDTKPYILTPQSPPDYPVWTENAGFEKIKDLYAWRLNQREGLNPKLRTLANRVQRKLEVRVRKLDMKRYDEEIATLLTFYNAYWENNWGEVKITEAEADLLARDFKRIVDPNLVLFLYMEGKLAGLALGYPDANQVFAKMKDGRLFPFGFIKLLNKNKIIDRVRLPILGVKPEFRNKGLELVLIREFYDRGVARGYLEAECSWILEDNDAINKGIEAAGGELYKTYRLYQKEMD